MRKIKILLITFLVSLNIFSSVSADTVISPIVNKYQNLKLGVYYNNLTTNTQVSNLATTQFVGASTTKVLTAITIMKMIENKKLSYNTPAVKNGPTIGWEIQQMINRSNNTSWNVLNIIAGWNAIISTANSLGMTGYNCNGNILTPKDDAVMLKALYSGQALNVSDTKILLSYMQNTNDESLIPAALPKDAIVYHKYGWLDGEGIHNVLNDTAIVIYRNQKIILSIYTDSLNSPSYSSQVNAIHDLVGILIH